MERMIFSIGYILVGLCLSVVAFGQEEFVVWVDSPLNKIFKEKEPLVLRKAIRLEAAKGEYEPAQIAIRGKIPLENVRVEFSDLRAVKGKAVISKNNLKYNFVGFVPIRKNTPGTPAEEILRKAPCEIPDPLLEDKSIKVEAETTQPIWITLFVPEKAKEGLYEGSLEVITSRGSVKIPISLRVFPFALPKERHLWLTNWFNPWNIAKFHKVEIWSEPFWKILENYAKNMAEHRQNVIITPVLSLTKISELKDGRLKFDFSNFDRWVEIFKKAGVIGRIEGGHLAGRSDWTAKEFDLSGYEVIREDGTMYFKPSVKVSAPECREFLSQFLPALQKHLKEKGWLEIYIQHLTDEPIDVNAESYKLLASLVKEFMPQVKRIDANQSINLVGALDIWVPILHEFDHYQNFYKERQRANEEVWFYTCLAPTGKYPNRFIDYSLLKVRLLHWINWLYQVTGYLHWGYNYWSDEPFKDVEPGTLPPGDAFIVYPGKEGPLNSLRFEMLREGMEDFEYLWLLENLTGSRAKGEEMCRTFIRSITDYDKRPAKLMSLRSQVAQEIIKALR